VSTASRTVAARSSPLASGRRTTLRLAVCLLLCLAALLGMASASQAQVVFPGPTLYVSGNFSFAGAPQPYMLSWKFKMHCSGARWGANEGIEIHLYGPLNTLGATPTDRYIATLAADAAGNLDEDVFLPYDGPEPNGPFVNGFGSKPDIPRPGRYQVLAKGTLHPEAITDTATATHEINLFPLTVPDYVNVLDILDWGKSRGGRDGVVGAPSPDREDPEWPSVWSVQPVELYATVADTGTDGGNQGSIISYQDYPGTHFAHDANLILEPDEEYRWLLGGANFLGTPPDRDAGRMELAFPSGRWPPPAIASTWSVAGPWTTDTRTTGTAPRSTTRA
jgi:hypothetical protein